jgi:hypothetical protein
MINILCVVVEDIYLLPLLLLPRASPSSGAFCCLDPDREPKKKGPLHLDDESGPSGNL